MKEPPIPANEVKRMSALRALQLLDTPPEARFDRITRLATMIFNVPIALVTLVDVNRQWFKSCIGLELTETPRGISFCAHAILQHDPLIIPDALGDPRFFDNPLVRGEPFIRFYAGQPLSSPEGYNFGTLCIMDRVPRTLSLQQIAILQELAGLVENELNALHLNQALSQLRASQAELAEQYHLSEQARGEMNAVFDATNEAMVVFAQDGRMLAANRRFAEIFGLELNQVVGRKFSDLIELVERVADDSESIIARLGHSARENNIVLREIVIQKFPVHRELELFSTPVRGRNGKYLGRLYSFRDVTAERELAQLKNEFVSLVSHELRTPLTSIKGYVDFMLDGEAGALTPEQREFLGTVKQNAQRLILLITDLLDVSRIEAGKIELERTLISLAPLVQNVEQTLRPQLNAKEQTLTVDVPNNLPPVWANGDRLTQIFINLISNAIQYTPAQGHIHIHAEPRGDIMQIAIADEGIGMSEQEQAHLFERYYRVRRLQGEGLGLGLAIARSLIELHGGEIQATSAPGRGSTFTFTIPLKAKSEWNYDQEPSPAA